MAQRDHDARSIAEPVLSARSAPLLAESAAAPTTHRRHALLLYYAAMGEAWEAPLTDATSVPGAVVPGRRVLPVFEIDQIFSKWRQRFVRES